MNLCRGSNACVTKPWDGPMPEVAPCEVCGRVVDVLESSAKYGHFIEHTRQRKKLTRAERKARR